MAAILGTDNPRFVAQHTPEGFIVSLTFGEDRDRHFVGCSTDHATAVWVCRANKALGGFATSRDISILEERILQVIQKGDGMTLSEISAKLGISGEVCTRGWGVCCSGVRTTGGQARKATTNLWSQPVLDNAQLVVIRLLDSAPPLRNRRRMHRLPLAAGPKDLGINSEGRPRKRELPHKTDGPFVPSFDFEWLSPLPKAGPKGSAYCRWDHF